MGEETLKITPNSSAKALTLQKLLQTAKMYCQTCPALSRLSMQTASTYQLQLGLPETPASEVCQYCASVFLPGNHRVVIVPRMRPLKKRHKLLTRLYSRAARRWVTLYRNSHPRKVVLCGVCKKKTVFLIKKLPKLRRTKLTVAVKAQGSKRQKLSRSEKKQMLKEKKKQEINNLFESFRVPDTTPANLTTPLRQFTTPGSVELALSMPGSDQSVLSTPGSEELVRSGKRKLGDSSQFMKSFNSSLDKVRTTKRSKTKSVMMNKTLQMMLQQEEVQSNSRMDLFGSSSSQQKKHVRKTSR